MPTNEDGEFELVLGNRQLISVFLIVVVLLGAFFSMGYIVGRNSPAAAVETAVGEKPSAPAAGSADRVNPDAPTEQSGSTASGATSDPTPPVAPPEIAKTPSSSQVVRPKPSPVPPAPSAPAPSVHAAAAGEPPGGQYWQVVATARPDAEIIAEALGKKGFHTFLAPAPKDGVFRVLVGPLADASTQAQMRTNLESAGFKNPIMRKY